MIYQLNDDYIDIEKLEHISDIKGIPNVTPYFFRYQVNGYVYDSDCNESKEEIIQLRNNLIDAWKNYKEQR